MSYLDSYQKRGISFQRHKLFYTTFNFGSLRGCFTKADSITYKGNSSVTSQNLLVYSNLSIDNSKYVIYSNAVNTNEEKYDLIIYPSKGSQNAYVTNSVTPSLYTISRGYGCYKLVITEHGNINHPISMNVLFGISDLDDGEYIILPFNYSEIHKGIYLTRSTSNSPQGIKYIGNKASNTDNEMYNTNCTFGEISIPFDGRKCKIVCVFGKKYLFFGKNQDMTILIEKEDFLCLQQRSRFDRSLQITT